MEELEKNRQMAEQAQLSKKERRQLKKQRKGEEEQKERRKREVKKAVNIVLVVLVVGGGITGLSFLFGRGSKFPPTSSVNHSENSPPAHIVTQFIPDAVQRHMIEHADGGGKPGIIIQYNCEDFECAPNLIENLTGLVRQYPENVYLAPNSYDGKIILTKRGKREILDNFNEQAIKDFIEL